jgi:hypothetical protein
MEDGGQEPPDVGFILLAVVVEVLPLSTGHASFVGRW